MIQITITIITKADESVSVVELFVVLVPSFISVVFCVSLIYSPPFVASASFVAF